MASDPRKPSGLTQFWELVADIERGDSVGLQAITETINDDQTTGHMASRFWIGVLRLVLRISGKKGAIENLDRAIAESVLGQNGEENGR
jgi:hypothetical protein